MGNNSNDMQDIKILIERFRELSIDLAAAKDRELSNRLESYDSKSKIKNSLKMHISRFPFIFRTLIKIKGFFR